MNNPNDWINAAERIVSRAFGFGLVTLIITGLLSISFRNDFISKSALGGVAFDVTNVLLVVSAGLLLVGILAWLYRLLLRIVVAPFAAIARGKKASAEKIRLLQNITMMHAESRVLLLYYMGYTDGRFRYPGKHPRIDDLVSMGLVRAEEPSGFGYLMGGDLMQMHEAFRDGHFVKSVLRMVHEEIPGSKDPDQLHLEVRRIFSQAHGEPFTRF